MEIWKDVPGFGDHYQASSLGRIRVKDRVIEKRTKWGGTMKQFYPGKELSLINNKGYRMVRIGFEGKKINVSAHAMVLLAFHGPKPDGYEACHNNGDPADNRPENLRWDTHLSNNRDRKRHGNYQDGERHPMAKITDQQALEIYRSDEPTQVLSDRYGICATKVSAIRLGKTWSAVTGGVPRSGFCRMKRKCDVLDSGQYYEIRAKKKAGISAKQLAAEYGISEGHVYAVIRGRVGLRAATRGKEGERAHSHSS